ncbi:MAG: type II toxin-antitoxin system prevent-host-death family antitoxin [Betaproteobacteria bacterium]|nr:type II toxin-antitoxin system prevent-host-death family antitoxin [Betaproteobacteria bacterium]
MKTVGTSAAKTHFSQLLDLVAKGESITITRHGEAVAQLVPAKPVRDPRALEALVEEIKRTRKGRSLHGIKIKHLIHEGRKY